MQVEKMAVIAGSVCLLMSSPVFAGKDCEEGALLVINNSDGAKTITRQSIESLPQKSIETSTHWEKKGVYTGPLLSEVIALAGKTKELPKQLEVYTWDNYKTKILYGDLVKYGAILSTKFNGKNLKLEDFGPLYIMFPYDSHKDLRRPAGLMKFAWQVCRIDLE